MPVFDQGYQHWQGAVGSHAWRWLAITRQGVRAQLKNRRAKYLVIAAWMPALILVVFLALWGLFEQKSDFIKPFMFIFQGLPEDLREGPKAFRTSIWTLAFHFYLQLEVALSLLLTLLIGPDLISQDLRFNAFPLYLSRPMRRFDYFLGKLGIIATFISAVTIVPALIAYNVGVAFSLDIGVIADTWRILVGCIVYGVVISLVCGLVMLAFSSLSRNSRVVAAMWVALWMISGMISDALVASSVRSAESNGAPNLKWRVISFAGNLDRVREGLLDTDAAYDQIMNSYQDMFNSAKKMAASAREAQNGPLARILLGRKRQPDPIEVDFSQLDEAGSNVPTRFLAGLKSAFPWTWSAGLLAAMCGLSICILSTRVKSLDRLR